MRAGEGDEASARESGAGGPGPGRQGCERACGERMSPEGADFSGLQPVVSFRFCNSAY